MRITEYFIKRPVAAITLNLLILLGGILCAFHLPFRLHPLIVIPSIYVNVDYPGASAKTVESFVTAPLERAISGISNIDYVTSASWIGSSEITVYFDLNENMNTAYLGVLNAVANAQAHLPQNAHPPVVQKNNLSMFSVMTLSVTNTTVSPLDLTNHINNITVPTLQNIQGVGGAFVNSAAKPQVWLMLNPKLMAANNITAEDVKAAVNSFNVNSVSGYLNNKAYSYPVSANTELKTMQEFENIVLAQKNGHIVRFKDIGRVQDHSAILNPNWSVLAYVNGKRAITIGLPTSPKANDIQVANKIKAEIPRLEQQLPKGSKIKAVFNKTLYIKAILMNTLWALIAAIIIVVLVILGLSV